MADAIPFPELSKQMAQLGASFKSNAPNLQLFNLRMKAMGVTLGPLQNYFVKGRQAADLFGEVMGFTGEATEQTGKTIDTFNESLKATSTLFGGIVKDVLVLIGIFMAAITVIALIAGSFDNMNSVVPGSSEAFTMVKEAGASLWGQIQELIAVFDGLGASVGGIGGVLQTVAGILLTWLAVVISVYAAIAEGYVEVLTLLGQAGVFDTIIEGVGTIFATVQATVAGIGEQLGIAGGGAQGFVDLVRGLISSVIGFLQNAGFFELVNDLFQFLFTGINAVIVVVGFLFRAVIAYFQATAPMWNALIAGIKIGIDIVVGALRVFFQFWSAIFSLITGDVDGFGNKILGLGDIFQDTFDRIAGHIEEWKDNVMELLSPVLDVLEGVGDFIGEGIGNIGGSVSGLLGFSEGGVVSGPAGGYPVNLHGTEAVVPLPNGRSIPVELSGAVRGQGGGDTINLSVTVNGGNGNAREVAKQVSEEVARVFKNRSRSSGFTRGL